MSASLIRFARSATLTAKSYRPRSATLLRGVLAASSVVFASMVGGASFSDDFNRANGNTIGNGWTETETTGTGARILNNTLTLGSTTAGREWVWQSSTGIFSTLSSSTAPIEWTFNMRQSRADPSGFDSSNYGLAFVLATTNTDFTLGDGYAVVLGQSGATDAVRLVRFTGGMDGNSNLTNIITGAGSALADIGTEFLSIRVVYDPTTNGWSFFGSASTTGYVDPRTVATQIGATTVDATYVNSTMGAFGALWNHATGGTEFGEFDNVSVPEPSTYLAGALLISAVGWHQRRRLGGLWSQAAKA